MQQQKQYNYHNGKEKKIKIFPPTVTNLHTQRKKTSALQHTQK